MRCAPAVRDARPADAIIANFDGLGSATLRPPMST
jgi:hypothetical protein